MGNLVQRSASARKAFWAVEAPLALGAIANLAFAEDVKAKFMRSPRLRTFLMTVAEPLMDSWSEEVREEATRLFSCLIADGQADKEWIEQGGAEVFQKSVSLED